MVAFTLRRIGSGLVLIILIPSIAFLLMSLASGNVARNVLGRNASAEQVAAFSSLYGLDRPIWEQYLDYVRDVFQGDFGTSYFTSEDVVDAMLSRVPVTIRLSWAPPSSPRSSLSVSVSPRRCIAVGWTEFSRSWRS